MPQVRKFSVKSAQKATAQTGNGKINRQPEIPARNDSTHRKPRGKIFAEALVLPKITGPLKAGRIKTVD